MIKLKENPMSRLKKTLNGVNKGIYSFGIMTSENPMGEKTNPSVNNKRQEELKEILRNSLFQFIPIKGMYGNLENPYIILNINKDELLDLGSRFNQESVIYARNYFDYVEFQYWQQEGNGKFDLLDTSDYYINLEDPKDFYSYKKEWKFKIPFSIFEQINEVYNIRYRDLSENTIKYIEKLNKRIVSEENKTMKHFVELRARINYFLKEQPVKMMNKSIVEARSMGGAYWVKYNNVYEVDRNHVQFIIDNPEKFEFTLEEIKEIYNSYGEKLGQEGKAREHIIKEVARRGWIRVRHYIKPQDYWTVQFDSHRKRKRSIDKFIDYALDNIGMKMNDAIALLGYDDNYSKQYTFMQGGVGSYLVNERNKQKPKKI